MFKRSKTKRADPIVADASSAADEAVMIRASVAPEAAADVDESNVSPTEKTQRPTSFRGADQWTAVEDEGAAFDAHGAESEAEARRGADEGWGRARRQRQRIETRAQLLDRLTNPLLSLHEAGILLGVCSATVRRYCDAGRLPHIRTPGGQRRFRLHEVLTLMRETQARRQEKQRSLAPRKARRRTPSRK